MLMIWSVLKIIKRLFRCKTAIGIATELNNDEINELVCIVETNKIMIKNDKEAEKKSDI